MKNLSLAARTLLGLAALAGLAIFLLIVDLGVNAGRIHYGVSVAGFDIGGMTGQEALTALRERKALLRHEEICFRGPRFRSCTVPARLGWAPDPSITRDEAMRVGRDDAPFGALGARLRAWVAGVNVPWSSGPRAHKVDRLLDDWERELASNGHRINRGRLRFRITRAILTFPRRPFRIPLEH